MKRFIRIKLTHFAFYLAAAMLFGSIGSATWFAYQAIEHKFNPIGALADSK